jgi:arylsulfatase A-like enzyme
MLKFALQLYLFSFVMNACCSAVGADGNQLNVLFIAIDDLRPELGVYGVDQVKSPNIDRLAEQGLVFNRAYCQEAICGASRISLLTGLYCQSTKIYGIKTKKKDKLPDITSLPKHFKDNGYQTISIGKIYHHSDDDPEAWTKEPYRAMKGSGYVTDEANALVELNRETNPNAGTKGPPTETADIVDHLHHDGMLADRAVDELKGMDKDKPFFLAVGFRKPHLPFTPPKKYWDLYDPSSIDTASNPFWPEHYTPYTMNNFGELRNYYGMPKGKGEVKEDLARHLKHGYYACVSFIDAQVGKILDELDRQGLKENTIVILWGDHGWKLGEHKSWAKHTNFEIDTRVPLILRVPGRGMPDQSSEAIVEFVDIYPTLSELCGLALPAHLEGTSFAPLLEDPDREWKKAAFSVWVHASHRYDEEVQVIGYAMKTDRYRYIEWKRTKTGKVEAVELYDHQSDPEENINVCDKPEYQDVIKELSEMLSAGWSAARPDTSKPAPATVSLSHG